MAPTWAFKIGGFDGLEQIDGSSNLENPVEAIHAAGNLRQHEGPSIRNMCM